LSRIKLRTRLIILTLGSALILTLITISGTLWSYSQLRQQVSTDTSKALDAQTAEYLQQVTRQKTGETATKLTAVRGLVLAAHNYLLETAFESSLAFDELREAPNGWRWSGETTATLVSPVGNSGGQNSDIQITHSLNALLPSLANSSDEIERISFLSANGVVRTFPYIEPQELRPGWRVTLDPSYTAAAPEANTARAAVWVPLHDSITGADQVVSIAKPVYFGDTFRGVLVADISMKRLSRYLESVGLDTDSFAALIDGSGRVLAAPPLAQQQLIGRILNPDEDGPFLMSDEALSSLGPALNGIINQQINTSVVQLGETEYILAYAGVDTLGWSLLIATPRDDAIKTTQAMTAQIDEIVEHAQTGTLGVTALALLLLIGGASLGVRHWFSRPLDSLIQATDAVAGGSLRPINIHRRDEIGQLASSFNHMVGALEASRSEIVAANHRLELTVHERTADLMQAVDRLEESAQQQQVLLQTLHDVSTPVLPVIQGVLVVPLIGQLDDERLARVTASLLQQIQHGNARIALLDVTGAPIIDTGAARAIIQLVQAAHLLGCETMLVGVVPEVAQTLVTLGVDLSGIHTAVDLQSGVEQIMRTRGRAAGRRLAAVEH
jgi:anti-anti-sigma regulatory factor/HAMP domain-containing protein